MSHRFGISFRSASARDLVLLAVGAMLVSAGVTSAIGVSSCGSLVDLSGGSPATEVGSPSTPGGEQE
jgi:hypothetical protein